METDKILWDHNMAVDMYIQTTIKDIPIDINHGTNGCAQ